MENKNFEYAGWKVNGFVALLLFFAVLGLPRLNTLRKGYNLLICVPLIVLGVVHRLKGITAGSRDQRLEQGLTSAGFSFLFSSTKLPVTLSLLSLSLWKGFSRVLGRHGLAPQG